MMRLLLKVWHFNCNPQFAPLILPTKLKVKIVLNLSLLAIFGSVLMGTLTGILFRLAKIEIANTQMQQQFENLNPFALFGLAVIIAPVLEEFIFRGPMVFFKKRGYFAAVYYFLTLLFGLVHLSNFDTITNAGILMPLLVLPQLCAGLFLGFTRVKIGLLWSMLVHALHNAVLIAPLIFLKLTAG